jgi:hypothetical protein
MYCARFFFYIYLKYDYTFSFYYEFIIFMVLDIGKMNTHFLYISKSNQDTYMLFFHQCSSNKSFGVCVYDILFFVSADETITILYRDVNP